MMQEKIVSMILMKQTDCDVKISRSCALNLICVFLFDLKINRGVNGFLFKSNHGKGQRSVNNENKREDGWICLKTRQTGQHAHTIIGPQPLVCMGLLSKTGNFGFLLEGKAWSVAAGK